MFFPKSFHASFVTQSMLVRPIKIIQRSETEMNTHAEAVETMDPQTHEMDGKQPFLYALTGQSPWWVVSALLHVLVIVLAGLVSLAIALPQPEEVIMITVPLIPQPEM